MRSASSTASYTRRMSTQPPIEDISAIVNRFQAWAGAQAPAVAKDGVRELTYDEAIRSRRPHTSKAASPAVASQGAKKSTQAPADATAGKTRKPAKPKKRTVPPRHGKDAQQPRETSPVAAPAFREVLAEKVSILPAITSQEVAMERRTTALSLRISLAEHALLKRRAAEANLSVSCYLRNCAFEVEHLRAQLAAVQAEPKFMQPQPPERVFLFASCFGFVRRLFFGKTTSLTIRV